MEMVVPTPMPSPPGVAGLWPIIVDSVMIVSVMVSMATSPMTGAASLMRITSTWSMDLPALSSATLQGTLPVFGEVKLVTALFFDAGVYLIVVGLVLDILRSLGARLDLDAEDLEELRAVYVDATTSPSTAALRRVPGVDANGARSDLSARRRARLEAAENQGASPGGMP